MREHGHGSAAIVDGHGNASAVEPRKRQVGSIVVAVVAINAMAGGAVPLK